MIPAVSKIENQAVHDLYAQYRIRSMKKASTRAAIFDAFVLKPFLT